MAIDESTAILGRSKVADVRMMQAVICLGFVIASAQYSVYPASYKILEEQRGFSVQDLAVISSYEKIANSVSVVVWGIYVNKLPKFTILSGVAVVWALSTMPMAFATTYSQLLTLRILSGLMGGCLAPLSAVVVASSVPRQHRGKCFGFMLFFENIGNIVGQTIMIEFQHTEGVFGLQGWQICYTGLAFVCAVFAMLAAGFAMLDQSTPVESSNTSFLSLQADLYKIMSIPTVVILSVQGMFRSSSVQVLQFTAMWIQYQGFDDRTAAWINNARFVGWMLGGPVAGWAADSVAKSHGDWSRITFGQVGDALRIVFVLVAFGLIPATVGPALAGEGKVKVVAALFCLGFAQPWAYVGMVRPFLTEAVSPRLVGMTTSVVHLSEHMVGAFVSGPAVALTIAGFGYVESGTSQMSAATNASNGAALGKCILWTDTILQVLMLGTLGLLYWSYDKDKAAVASEKLSAMK